MKSKLMRILCLIYVVGLVFFAINYDKIKQLGKEDVKTEEATCVESFSSTQCIEESVTWHTEDGPKVDLRYYFTYDIVNPEKLYMTYGASYEEKIIRPVLQNVIKMAIGQNSIQDLSTYRDRVFSDISQLLIERLSSEFFENETFKIVGLCFHDHPAFEDYGEKDDLVRETYTTRNPLLIYLQ